MRLKLEQQRVSDAAGVRHRRRQRACFSDSSSSCLPRSAANFLPLRHASGADCSRETTRWERTRRIVAQWLSAQP